MADAANMKSTEDDKKDAMSVGQNSLDQGSIDSCETKEELENDDIDVSEITEEITKQVTAGTKALGSMFNMAWGKTQKVADSGMKASTSLFNFAAGYDLNKPSDDEDEDTSYQKKDCEPGKDESIGAIPKSQSSFFGTGLTSGFSGAASSAWSKVSDMTTSVAKSTSWTSDLGAATATSDNEKNDHEGIDEEAKEEGQGLFGGLGAGIGADLSSLVKVASDATTAIKAKSANIINATILNDFNKEQEDFIKNKGETTTTDIEEKKGD